MDVQTMDVDELLRSQRDAIAMGVPGGDGMGGAGGSSSSSGRGNRGVTIACAGEGVVGRRKRSFVRKTRRGGVLKVVKEHYLRDDIPFEFPLLPSGDGDGGEGSRPTHCIVPDSNVALHFLDFLESEKLRNVVICSTVLDEVRHVNLSAYNRLTALVKNNKGVGKNFFVFCNEHHSDTYVTRERDESINDRNDRAIREVAAFYNANFVDGGGNGINSILLTEDRNNLKTAEEVRRRGVERRGGEGGGHGAHTERKPATARER